MGGGRGIVSFGPRISEEKALDPEDVISEGAAEGSANCHSSYEDDKQQLVENWDLASATQFGHSVCVSRAWGCYRATRRHVMEGGDIEDRDTAG
ncbi:hypothetical protein MCOR14_009040 [Pyricularia oryzae]|uniref:Uncharacterized protein n=1 Tax=Pyricularia grisea TaxID=148305 RepID=A0ABQ8N8P1_PYRGI|nr:hypothetical protein MCOR33_010355 [Pyricularia grisea]KAI6340677.1 hypothetical protein MCOR30_002484 [Pyricularia oryzae]KAI6389141.1 hypothetical protein MCOR23_010348 [Pyricularia oryzae]KAI6462547.1 hypothetical protein MCOR17_005905 [Pyricularia oryzae]KAI6473894.1 hypothetical protein MCOR18_008058 [Pyricularia oryzae]